VREKIYQFCEVFKSGPGKLTDSNFISRGNHRLPKFGFRPIRVIRLSPYSPFAGLLDYSVCAQHNYIWNFDAERLGGFEIDDRFKLERLLDG